MNIDFTKPLQTRNGRKLRLLCTDASGYYPILCLIEDNKDTISYTSDGRVYKDIEDHPNNLMNVPEEVTVDSWINIYEGNIYFSTKEEALAMAAQYRCLRRLATLHIKRTVPVGHVDE